MRVVTERGMVGAPTPELSRGTACAPTPPLPLREGVGVRGLAALDWDVSTPHPNPPPQGGRG